MSRIFIISQFFYPSESSTSQLMTDLALGLARSGFSVTVLTGTSTKGDLKFSQVDNLSIIRVPSIIPPRNSILLKIISSLFFLIFCLLVTLFKAPKEANLLIASNPPYIGIIGSFYRYFRKGEYFFVLQDIFPESAVLSGFLKAKGIGFIFFSSVIKKIIFNSKRTIVLTESMRHFLESKYPEVASLKKLLVIENWSIASIQPLEKKCNSFAEAHDLEQYFTVLYSGNMGRMHDIEGLAETIRFLQHQPIKFLCIGDGPKRSILEEYILTYKLKNIVLLPFQSKEYLPLSLTACDLSLVSLIKDAEALVAPCKLYGMLAAGRAIVSVSQPNSYLDELLKSQQCGVNCPPHQPEELASVILDLYNKPDQVKVMGENAHRLYINSYRFERALSEYLELLAD